MPCIDFGHSVQVPVLTKHLVQARVITLMCTALARHLEAGHLVLVENTALEHLLVELEHKSTLPEAGHLVLV